MKNLYLIGGGGHCNSCIDVIELEKKFKIKGIFDIKEKVGKNISGYKIIGSDKDILDYYDENNFFLITIGQIYNSELRKKYFNMNLNLATVISPRSYISKKSKILEGSIIMHDVVVNSGAHIGKNCIINTKSIIEHDVVVGNNCHISTGAIINGSVTIGDDSFVGSGSITKHSIVIQKKSFIKANSLVK